MSSDTPSKRRPRNVAVCRQAADAPTDNTQPQTIAVAISPVAPERSVAAVVAPSSGTETCWENDQTGCYG